MNSFQPLMEGLQVGDPLQHGNLAMFPLFSKRDAIPDYLTLDEALESGKARIGEVSQGGSVPELAFENLSTERILLSDGEELVGARQNRILNLTLLIGGSLKVVIPVSCVEQGRWAYRTRHFMASKRTMYASGRAEKMAQVSASLRSGAGRRSDQGALWANIHGKAARMNSMSDTMASEEIYTRNRARSGDYLAEIQWQKGQVGAVFAVNGNVVGMDLYDSSATMQKQFTKVLESYVLDALDVESVDESATPAEAAQEFLEAVSAASEERFKALAEGEDVRLESPRIIGGGLVDGDRLIHLSAFSAGTARHEAARRRTERVR